MSPEDLAQFQTANELAQSGDYLKARDMLLTLRDRNPQHLGVKARLNQVEQEVMKQSGTFINTVPQQTQQGGYYQQTQQQPTVQRQNYVHPTNQASQYQQPTQQTGGYQQPGGYPPQQQSYQQQGYAQQQPGAGGYYPQQQPGQPYGAPAPNVTIINKRGANPVLWILAIIGFLVVACIAGTFLTGAFAVNQAVKVASAELTASAATVNAAYNQPVPTLAARNTPTPRPTVAAPAAQPTLPLLNSGQGQPPAAAPPVSDARPTPVGNAPASQGQQAVGQLPTPGQQPAAAGAAPASGTLLKIGQTTELEGYLITVNNVEWQERYASFVTPKAGHVYLAVDITIGSNRTSGVSPNGLSTKVKDGSGFSYTIEILGYKEPLLGGSNNLQPGNVSRGWVTFQVPRGSKDLVFEYTPLLSTRSVQFGLGSLG
jgi:hypothetical protein